MHDAVVPAPADAYEATGHAPLHAAAVPWPLSAYRPALQLEHAATFDTVEYFPAAHAVQLLAPGEDSVSVTEPAAQSIHASVDPGEYRPASQAEQLLAPELESVSVTDPAPHSTHASVETAE